jgi:dihydrofolate reductase
MRHIIALEHISLDGYVALADGTLDGFEALEASLAFVCDLTRNADAALFGRISYQLLDDYWPNAHHMPNASPGTIDFSNWYNSAEKIVLSKFLASDSQAKRRVIGKGFTEEIKKIKHSPGKDILLFGSPSVFQALEKINAIDVYWIFVNPVIFGKGIPLFATGDGLKKLKLISHTLFSNGETALCYEKL